MKYLTLFLLLFCSICYGGEILPGKGKQLLVADSGKRKLSRFNASGKLIWEYKNVYCYDLQVLKNGNILFVDEQKRKKRCSYIREITPDKKVVWEYKVSGEAYSCQRTPEGTTVIGACTQGRIIEVDKKGKVLHSIKMTYRRGRHNCVRIVRKTTKGTYLAAHFGDRMVREYNSKGKVLRALKLKYPVFGCEELKNGNILVSTEHAIYEYNQKNKLIWSLEQKDLPETRLHWLTNAKRLKNGNTMICNWLGHRGKKKYTPIFVVSPDKKIVSKFTDTKQTSWIAIAKIIPQPKKKK